MYYDCTSSMEMAFLFMHMQSHSTSCCRISVASLLFKQFQHPYTFTLILKDTVYLCPQIAVAVLVVQAASSQMT